MKTALKHTLAARKKFPNLEQILFLHPSHESDDAWALDLSSSPGVLHLEENIELDLHDIRFFNPSHAPNIFCRSPTFQSLEVRHTYASRLVAQQKEEWASWGKERELLKRHLRKWHDWLYCNPELDKRVTSIERWVYEHPNPREIRDHAEDQYLIRRYLDHPGVFFFKCLLSIRTIPPFSILHSMKPSLFSLNGNAMDVNP
jgi:hypothetical protein